jgi:hypothetical protein
MAKTAGARRRIDGALELGASGIAEKSPLAQIIR